MWKKIKDSEYFLLFTKEYDYEICVTDFICVWNSLYSEKAFLAQLKKSNDDLELPNDSDFVRKGLNLLSNPDHLKKLSIKEEENGKTLFITMTISFGFPFCLECKLTKGSEGLFFQKITQPLLKTLDDLRASQSELRRLLIKKDNEIEEYKCEGGEIVLRHLKTVAFNDEEHKKKHKVFEENFGTLDSLTSIIEKAVDIPGPNAVKEEPNITQNPGPANIKVEHGLSIKAESEPEVKVEPRTEVADEPNSSAITVPVTCKQEVKRETTLRTHVPRKKSKFNF